MRSNDATARYITYMETQERARKTIYGYGSDLASFKRFYEQRHNVPWLVEDTTTADVEAFMQMLYEVKKLQPASRNRILHCLKSFFKYLHSRGLCPHDPTYGVQSLRINRKERAYLSEEEYIAIVDAIDHPVIQLATRTLWYTGLRISELTHLCLDNVNFAQNVIHVVGKGHNHRDVPINPILRSLLERYRDEHRGWAGPVERFFALESTGGLSPSHYNRELERAVKSAGISKKVTAHTFRHSFATNLINKGVHLVVVQKLLGHKTIDITVIYTHASAESMLTAVNSL